MAERTCGSTRAGGRAGSGKALRTLPGLLALLALASCGDGNPVLFSQPAAFEVEGALELVGEVAGEVAGLPTIRVVDGDGNPAPGVTVAFRVEAGGGGATPAETVTDVEGRVRPQRWQLGQTAGLNVLVAEVGELGEVRIEAVGQPGPPDRLVAVSPVQQDADVATVAPQNPVARLTDRFGNGLEGHEIHFQPDEDAGTVENEAGVTGPDGSVSAGAWSLGTRSGNQVLVARAVDLAAVVTPLQFVVRARPDEPVAMEAASPTSQSAAAGTDVLDPPRVRFSDQYDNPVAGMVANFQVTVGGGSINAASATSTGDGIARLQRWTLGPELGANQVVASAEGFPDVVFEAEGTEATLVLTIDAVHLNQGSQDYTGTLGGIAGRPGVLRVIARANESNSVETDVLVRLYQGETLFREEVLQKSEPGVPVDPDLRFPAQTWNLVLTGDDVVDGLRVEAILDPDQQLEVASRGGHRYPQEGTSASLDVQPLGDLHVHFIPVRLTQRGTTGNVDQTNIPTYLVSPRRLIPTDRITHSLDGVFVSDADLSEHEGWTDLLSDLNAKRQAESAGGQYYHGIVPAFSGIRYAGIAYVPANPTGFNRTGITWDNLPGASGTLAHELGHNLGRYHAPCGDVGNADLDYPYPDAIIGVPGYDIDQVALVHPTQNHDYMSYCSPRWTSDYTFGEILEWRRADPYATSGTGAEAVAAASSGAATTNGASAGPGLLVWGRIGAGGPVLNPAFEVEAPAALPAEGGPHRLRGLDRDGRELFAVSFRGTPPDHTPDPDEAHFSFVIPVDPAGLDALDRLELATPTGTAVRSAGGAPGAEPGARTRLDDPRYTLERVDGARVRLEWDGDAFPMVMLRDAASGRVTGLLRSGRAEFLDPEGRAEGLEVLLSNGVRSRVGERR